MIAEWEFVFANFFQNASFLLQSTIKMSRQINVWLSVIVIVLNLSYTRACTAIPNRPCACEYGDEYVDLTLAGLSVPLMATTNATKDFYTFYLNPCASLIEDGVDSRCKESSVCQKADPHSGEPVQWYPAGSTTVEYSGIPGLDLQFKYGAQKYDDVYRSATVNIVCDQAQGIEMFTFVSETILETGVHAYTFTLKGEGCCSTKYEIEDNSLSTGSVLLIIFFVLLALYLIGGVLFNKCMRGYTGVEMIPNYDFWADLPKLIMDGWTFIITCGCCAPSSSVDNAPAYDNI